MATSKEIKGFLAKWLQLGKGIEHVDGSVSFKPGKILDYHGYSQEFERWWHDFEDDAQDWVLSGTQRPLSDLYDANWEIIECARCDMPIPVQVAGVNEVDCPCQDLPGWPNTELPHPHVPSDARSRLADIRDRLRLN